MTCEEYSIQENTLQPSQINLTSGKSGFGAAIINSSLTSFFLGN